MTEHDTMNDSNIPDGLIEPEHSSEQFVTVSKSSFWWPWDSGEDRRKRLIARDHLLTLAQETAMTLKAARLKSKMTIADIEALTFVNAQIIDSELTYDIRKRILWPHIKNNNYAIHVDLETNRNSCMISSTITQLFFSGTNEKRDKGINF